MRVLSDWVDDLTTGKGAAQAANAALAEALRARDPALRDRAAELVLAAFKRAPPAPRAQILHLLQAHWWPPSKALGREIFYATLEASGDFAADALELEDVLLLWSHIAKFDRSIVPEIADAVRSDRPGTRRVAVGALGRLGEDGRGAVPALIEALADPERAVSEAALASLSALAPLAPEQAAPALWRELRAGEGVRRFQALTALRGLFEQLRREGARAPACAAEDEEALRSAVTATEPAVRVQAAGLLGLQAAVTAAAEDALVQRLADEQVDVAAAAAIALLRLRQRVSEANATLEKQLTSARVEDQDAAVYALEPADTDTLARARPALEAAAEKAHGVGREASVGLLMRLGS